MQGEEDLPMTWHDYCVGLFCEKNSYAPWAVEKAKTMDFTDEVVRQLEDDVEDMRRADRRAELMEKFRDDDHERA